MGSLSSEQLDLAVIRGLLIGIAPLLVGIVVVALLIGSVEIGRRRRAREPFPEQRPQERSGAWQTREELERGAPPDHGPGHQESVRHGYETQRREPDPLPRDGMRRLPHALKGFGNEGTREAGSRRNTWDPEDHG
jgi:hypothetical protein